MFVINVCEKTNEKQQACKRLFCNGVAYCSNMHLEEDTPIHWSICYHNTGHSNINLPHR
jgi:hypothetical protein